MSSSTKMSLSEHGSRDDFFVSIRHAELAASVLHEICRYRSGCVALAKDSVAIKAIKAITKLPLISIHWHDREDLISNNENKAVSA